MVAEAIFMIAGFLFGQIRTLQRLGWLANIAVWVCCTLYLSKRQEYQISGSDKFYANLQADERCCYHYDDGCDFSVRPKLCCKQEFRYYRTSHDFRRFPKTVQSVQGYFWSYERGVRVWWSDTFQ